MLKEVENMRLRHLQEEIDKEVLFCKYTTCCGTHNVCKILPNFMKQATLADKLIHALMLVLCKQRTSMKLLSVDSAAVLA